MPRSSCTCEQVFDPEVERSVRIESLQIIERERRISLEKGRGRREKREGN
jgi:hypothetical protein